MASPQRYQRLEMVDKETDHGSESDDNNISLPSRLQRRPWRSLTAVVVLLVVSNLIFAGLWLRSRTQGTKQSRADCVRPQLIYSPATSVLRYEKKRLWRDIDGPNPYTGNPRPEFDKAWRDIIAPITIKVSAEELGRYNEGDSTIAFKDGSGYLAEMGVYHELHCIKRVRRYLHMEYYYPNMTEEDRIREDKHIDHCLEYWRESVMCRGDTTMSTFFWNEFGYPTSRVYTDNECVDFHALDNWARQRMVDTSDFDQFVKDDE